MGMFYIIRVGILYHHASYFVPMNTQIVFVTSHQTDTTFNDTLLGYYAS